MATVAMAKSPYWSSKKNMGECIFKILLRTKSSFHCNTGGGDDIMPLFLSSKTQELFSCVADVDVTEENPCKLLTKEGIIQDMKTRAAVSDFHPVKQIMLVK